MPKGIETMPKVYRRCCRVDCSRSGLVMQHIEIVLLSIMALVNIE